MMKSKSPTSRKVREKGGAPAIIWRAKLVSVVYNEDLCDLMKSRGVDS